VDILSLLTRVQETGLAISIRDSLYLFPLLESAHVIGLALVFGTIAVIDLRLLGVASAHRPFLRVARDVFGWTWAAFALTATTGLLMFITNAVVYFNNTYFRVKVGLLVLAAVNVLVFELTARRTVHQWDRAAAVPAVARTVATVSLVVWVAVIVAGRMIGFTATRATAEPAPVEVNFDDLFGLPADGGTTPAPAPPGSR
jgi:hypothetical protein